MQQPAPPDIGSGQTFESQFQADAEQQQQNAGMGDMVEQRVTVLAQRVQYESGHQVADQRRQAQVAEDQAQQKGQREPERVHESVELPGKLKFLVMIAALHDHQFVIEQRINQSVFVVDAPRPETGELMLERFRFARVPQRDRVGCPGSMH